MNGSWKRVFVLATLIVSGLAGLAGCDHSPPVADGCRAACACLTFLDSERADCEQGCQTSAADPNDTALADCLQCADDSASCSAFQRDCSTLCGFSSAFNP